MRIDAHLLRKIGLCDRTEHLLRGLRGGQAVHIGRVLGFDEAHPARTAACKHRPAVFALMGKSVDKFTALFHDRKIRREVGVKYIVEAEALETCHHSAGCRIALVEAKAFRPCNSDRRRDLHNGSDFRICQCIQHLDCVITDSQRTGRAMSHALSAEGAVGVLESPAVADVDRRTGTGSCQIPDMHALDLIADLDAAHTLNALAGLADDRDA